MATKKEPLAEAQEIKEAPAIDRGEEYVSFQIPFTGADSKPVMIGVNGEFIRVRPGETVQVRRKFVEAYNNAQTQERAAYAANIKAQNASRKALAEL